MPACCPVECAAVVECCAGEGRVEVEVGCAVLLLLMVVVALLVLLVVVVELVVCLVAFWVAEGGPAGPAA